MKNPVRTNVQNLRGNGREEPRKNDRAEPPVARRSLFPELVEGWLAPARDQSRTFDLTTASVQNIHDAVDAGALTYERLVQLYLHRIEAYDEQGPKLNAVIHVNRRALAIARDAQSLSTAICNGVVRRVPFDLLATSSRPASTCGPWTVGTPRRCRFRRSTRIRST